MDSFGPYNHHDGTRSVLSKSGVTRVSSTNMGGVDLSKYDNVSLSDLHLDVRPRIKNIIEELFHEHDWSWPPLPRKDVRKARYFKRKKHKLFYNVELSDFATILSLIIGPLELMVGIGFGIVPKTFIVAMRECVEIVALIIFVFVVQGIFHTYAAVLGLALKSSNPYEIGFIYPMWTFEIGFPLLGIFSVFACYYMSQSWMMEKEMYLHLKGYNFHWYSKSMWDSYQTQMKCCGITSYKDWENYGPILYDDKHVASVPSSCCSTENCTFSPNNVDNVWSSGCRDKTLWILWGIYGVGVLTVFLSLILLCLGIRSTKEASRYAGDPIHKLLFDDHWSKKRMYNRSNRREELFFLLNHYCMILGKELGFVDEVEAAEKEETTRQLKFDKEMESDGERYENPTDSLVGNSPPTPSSFEHLVDDMYVPTNYDSMGGKEPKLVQWTPSLSATNDEFPLADLVATSDQTVHDAQVYMSMIDNYELMMRPIILDETISLKLDSYYDAATTATTTNLLLPPHAGHDETFSHPLGGESKFTFFEKDHHHDNKEFVDDLVGVSKVKEDDWREDIMENNYCSNNSFIHEDIKQESNLTPSPAPAPPAPSPPRSTSDDYGVGHNQVLSIVALEKRYSDEYGTPSYQLSNSYIQPSGVHIEQTSSDPPLRPSTDQSILPTEVGLAHQTKINDDTVKSSTEPQSEEEEETNLEMAVVHAVKNNDDFDGSSLIDLLKVNSTIITGGNSSTSTSSSGILQCSSTLQLHENSILAHSFTGQSHHTTQRTSSLTDFQSEQSKVLVARKSSSEFSASTKKGMRKQEETPPQSPSFNIRKKGTHIPVLMTNTNIFRKSIIQKREKKVTILEPEPNSAHLKTDSSHNDEPSKRKSATNDSRKTKNKLATQKK